MDMAKGGKATGGITPEDMEADKELNAEAAGKGFPGPGVRGPEVHPLRTPQSTPETGQQLHGHVDPVARIPVRSAP
jgi:hypothetical protein